MSERSYGQKDRCPDSQHRVAVRMSIMSNRSCTRYLHICKTEVEVEVEVRGKYNKHRVRVRVCHQHHYHHYRHILHSTDRKPYLIQHTPKTKARILILTNGIVLDAALDGVAEPDGLAVSVLVPVGSGVASEVAVPNTPARVASPSAAA